MSANTKKLTVLAMLTALSAVLITLVHFPLFPAAAFLQYDPADVAILIGAFAFGPLAGLAVTVIASAIQAFLLGGDGVYGFLMHVIASGTLALVVMVANHFITPYYMGVPTEVVDAMLVTVILPFNLLKAGINSVITFLVYKTVSRTLIHGEGWERESSHKAGSEG